MLVPGRSLIDRDQRVQLRDVPVQKRDALRRTEVVQKKRAGGMGSCGAAIGLGEMLAGRRTKGARLAKAAA